MQKTNWNYPTTMWVGQDRIKDLSIACRNLNINKPLLVTDKGLASSDIIQNSLSNLKQNSFEVILYSNVVGNPTGTNVNQGVEIYRKNNCDGVIAFGGGSGLDVGKAVAFMSGQGF
jgi:alcohol dehydrogenase class IV